jgi:hypothetical protein
MPELIPTRPLPGLLDGYKRGPAPSDNSIGLQYTNRQSVDLNVEPAGGQYYHFGSLTGTVVNKLS